jgi:hypothetical protein
MGERSRESRAWGSAQALEHHQPCRPSPLLPLSPFQIGVVSDFDLLSLDVPDIAPAGMFPALGGDWDAFFSSKEAALKGVSKT